ncbi:TetR/AcrR family transcriptional regulator [Saccharopolyspora montiporae]|nr:TetR/AcrR family transcriptional regulator [Saccharopolyspora sp. HNM0983]
MIDAGRLVLERDGYANFSTNRVAEAAGTSPGSLYQYFRDKDDLLTVILDQYWDEAAQRVEASLADRLSDSPDQMVRNVVNALLLALEQDSQLLHVAVEAIPQQRLQSRHQALRRRVQDLVSTYLNLLLRSSGRNASTRAWVIVVSMEGLAVRWVLDRPDISREELVEELTALVENYIGALIPEA